MAEPATSVEHGRLKQADLGGRWRGKSPPLKGWLAAELLPDPCGLRPEETLRLRSTEERPLPRDGGEKTSECGPVMAEEKLLEEEELICRDAVRNDLGRLKPVDGTCSTPASPSNVVEQPSNPDATEQLDEEQQLDFCPPSSWDEPLVTAEQVIEEIEEMMQDASEPATFHLDFQRSHPGFENALRSLTAPELSQRLQEAERNVQRFSEELVRQLAARDELDFEKEVKNGFISALLDVQTRQKELLRRRRRLKGGGAEGRSASRFSIEGISSVFQSSFRQTFGSGCSNKQFLTTVIPYEKKGSPPSVDDLQILTKILQAMRDDSDKVPGLLTDYILNVFCPT